nr:vacuolar protein sorting-associated protein 37B isoform X2 [Odocoileus virginianus texanus]
MAGAASEARFAGLSLVQLNELLEDEGQLTEMVQKMEETQNVQLNKEMTLASNRSLAEGNLLYQPQLDSRKAHLTQKYQELQVLFEAYQIKKTKLDKQSSSASLETLLALLQAEGAKIEEDTENMAEKFLDGELPLDSFIDVYQSKRKLAHMRRVKIEKLQEMVLKGQRLPQAPAPAPLPPRVEGRSTHFEPGYLLIANILCLWLGVEQGCDGCQPPLSLDGGRGAEALAAPRVLPAPLGACLHVPRVLGSQGPAGAGGWGWHCPPPPADGKSRAE